MKSAHDWLEEYAQTHRNPLNKKIHYFCVPLIFWSVIALLWIAPAPNFIAGIPGFNWATVLVAFILGFYWQLGWRYYLGMLSLGLLALVSSAIIQFAGFPLAWIAVSTFVVAWIGQFYGHHIEGQRPSFFRDILFLLIGPLWILDHFYRRLGRSK